METDQTSSSVRTNTQEHQDVTQDELDAFLQQEQAYIGAAASAAMPPLASALFHFASLVSAKK